MLDHKIDFQRLDRALRILFVVVLLLPSYFCFRFALTLSNVEQVATDLLAEPLPMATQYAIQLQAMFLLLPLALLALALVVAWRVTRPDYAAMIMGGCFILQFGIAIFLWTAITAPFTSIVEGIYSR